MNEKELSRQEKQKLLVFSADRSEKHEIDTSDYEGLV